MGKSTSPCACGDNAVVYSRQGVRHELMCYLFKEDRGGVS